MSFDINKPFTRRDGEEVLWWHEVSGGYIYGYSLGTGMYYAKTFFDGRSTSEQGGDLINTPEYEYRFIYNNGDTGTTRSKEDALQNLPSFFACVGLLQREVGTAKWSLIKPEEL